MSAIDSSFYCGRFFPAKIIKGLPKILKLSEIEGEKIENLHLKIMPEHLASSLNQNNSDSSSSFQLDYARLKDISNCECFVKKAASDGDNVGEDEFDGRELPEVLEMSEVFVLKSCHCNISEEPIVKAFITIQPFLSSRTLDNCLSLMGIYYDQNWIKESQAHLRNKLLAKERIFAALVELGVQLTTEINLGYTDTLLRVCLKSNPERVKILQAIGFQIVVKTRKTVLIKGTLEDDLLLIKNVQPFRQPRPEDDVIAAINRRFPDTKCEKQYEAAALLRVPCLPAFYTLNNGKILRIRMAQKSEATKLYDMFTDASRDGKGYGLSEFPTLNYFKTVWMLSCYCVIFEMVDDPNCICDKNNPIVACTLIGHSWHTRSKRCKAAESAFIIEKRVRGQGYAKEIISLEMSLIKELGFKSIINDFLASNVQMQNILSEVLMTVEYKNLGMIPRSNYTKGLGWDCQIVRFVNLEDPNVKTFKDAIKENNLRYNLNSKL